MKTSEQGIALIKRFEGFRGKPYLCAAGIPTIGYGSTYYPDGTNVTLDDDEISEAEASELMKMTLGEFEEAVNDGLSVEVEQGVFDALVSFSYNVGTGAFKRSTLLKKLNHGDIEGAAEELLRWNKGGGKILAGLTKRREAEKALFLA